MSIGSVQFRSRADGVAALDSPSTDWVQFERLIAELSARFIHLPDDEIEKEVGNSLGLLGTFLDVDRINLVEAQGETLRVLQLWAAPGHDPLPSTFPASSLPWYVGTLQRGEIIRLSSMDDIPESAIRDRQTSRDLGVKSHLAIPLKIGPSVVGALTFGTLRQHRDWPDDLVHRLSFVSEIFSNALNRKRSNEMLARQHRELAHVARVAALGELAAIIAHELNQPLTAILSNAEATILSMSRADADLSEAAEALADIAADATRAGEIIRRLRTLMRKENGARAPVDVNALLHHVEPILKVQMRESEVTAQWELEEHLPAILGDSIELQQVILNLVGNACHAMQSQPRSQRKLRIRTSRTASDQVLVDIIDNGPPVSSQTIEQMFEPFFTTKGSGLGMGLSISRSIAVDHNGLLWATRNDANGLTLHLQLPAC